MNPRELLNQNKFAILLVLSGLVIIGLGFLFPKITSFNLAKPQAEFTKGSLRVDIGGAVLKPGVYEITPSKEKAKRIEDIIQEAGGFTTDADLDWVTKNLNLATILTDEMKIYIPKKGESAAAGLNSTSLSNSSTKVLGVTSLININTATEAELDRLPAVGTVTAKKIISGRPYSSIEDLKNKKVVPASTFEKIKTVITI